MKTLLVLLVLGFFTPLAWAQLHASLAATASAPKQEVEHAPTVEQCQADQRLWLSKLEDAPRGTNDVTFDTLHAWGHEMIECQEVDPPNRWRYYNTASEVHDRQSVRVMDFIRRHNLWEQFKQEDAEGKR